MTTDPFHKVQVGAALHFMYNFKTCLEGFINNQNYGKASCQKHQY